MLFDTQLLENSLNATTLRHQVIANNIANLNTPGFCGQAVNFETQLRQAMEEGQDAQQVRPEVVGQNGRLDVNNEMCSLAKNQIMYNALSGRISGIFGALKWVIENAGR
jgi:flagellar basal-body rod protein FlgB